MDADRLNGTVAALALAGRTGPHRLRRRMRAGAIPRPLDHRRTA